MGLFKKWQSITSRHYHISIIKNMSKGSFICPTWTNTDSIFFQIIFPHHPQIAAFPDFTNDAKAHWPLLPSHFQTQKPLPDGCA